MKNYPLNVVILDDHPVVAGAVKDRLSLYPVNIIGVLHDVEGLVSLHIEPTKVDLWVIDLELGSANSWKLLEELSGLSEAPGIIVYTMHDSPWIKERLSRLSVKHMVNKSDAAEELDHALKAFFSGKPYYSNSFRNTAEVDGLTSRETEVLGMLVKGMSVADIAGALGISQSTVQTYRKSLMAKFGVHKLAEMIAKSRGLV